MGIWHTKILDNTKDFNSSDRIVSSSSFYMDDMDMRLGRLSSPNPKAILFTYQSISIALDGYISNKNSLCNSLKLNNYEAIGKIIVLLYLKYKEEGFYALEGDFSLILYDKKENITLLYTPFLTGYSLYYVVKNNILSVSTNPIELLRRLDVSSSLDKEQLLAYFSLEFSHWTKSVFKDLNEVKLGEIVTISSKGIFFKNRTLEEVFVPLDYSKERSTQYRALVTLAIEKYLIPNKKYGIMLSSGMDSSTLASLASKTLKESNRTLLAYSWMLPSYSDIDESQKIKALCDYLEIKLHLFNAEDYAPFSNLMPKFNPDNPFSNIYNNMISKVYHEASHDGIDILFNGHYGDDIFGNPKNILVDTLKDKEFGLFVETLKIIIAQRGYCNILKSPAVKTLLKNVFPFLKRKAKKINEVKWLSKDANDLRKKIKERQKEILFDKKFKRFETALLRSKMDLGVNRYLSMEYNLQRVEPYRNIALINYTLRLPTYASFQQNQTKYFAGEAMRGFLPESIRVQKRVGLLNQFALDSFMKNKHQVKEKLFDEREDWSEYIDMEWMEKKFKKSAKLEGNELLIIWMSLNLVEWKKYIKNSIKR